MRPNPRPRRQSRNQRIAVSLLLLGLTGCGGIKAYVRSGFLEHPPRRVAILPMVITYPYDLAVGQPIPAEHLLGRDLFRQRLYNAFAPYGYEDMPPADVDAKLAAAFGPLDEGVWRAATPQALGDALGVDAVVHGEISHIAHIASPVYTETSLAASLRMVETASGDVLWRTRVQEADRGGALMQKGQVVDFVQDQIRSRRADVKFLRVAAEAARVALKGLPNPPMAAAPRARASTAPRIAVLPLAAAKPSFGKGAKTLRYDLAVNLQDGVFEAVELQHVDAALAAHDGISLADLRQALGADAVLRGAVTEWGKHYLLLQSWVAAGLELELVDAATGTVLWRGKKTSSRQAGLSKGPTGYKSVVMAPITGLKTRYLERVADGLARDMVEELAASPEVVNYVQTHRSP
ncbi:MAG: DUF799 family lipoprotein [Candidatus Omnitrophica bacterium]|nr:DUF799 family lipoprotein [Candidatus Omnitrophota bacterium]